MTERSYQPWRDRSGRTVLNDSSIVDTSTRNRYRMVRPCGSSGQSDWLNCGSLTLARSLFGLATAKIVLDSYASETDTVRARGRTQFEVRATVVCRECGARTNWSKAGCPLWVVRWWSRNMERLTVAGISTTFQMELRPDDEWTTAAFGAWHASRIDPEKELNRLKVIGISSVEELTKRKSLVRPTLEDTSAST